MRIGSLFSGIGGLELGLEIAGVGRVVWQVERDKYCRKVLAHHWPDAERFEDVFAVGAHNLSQVDVICGGFPCPPVSAAGKRLGRNDERWIWPEQSRIIRELRPAFVVVENVAGLLTACDERGCSLAGDVLGDLAAIGYDAEWQVLSAGQLGAPQQRERIFILAYSNDERRRRQSSQSGGARAESWEESDRRCAELGNGDGGRREQHHAREREGSELGAGYVQVGDAESRGRGTREGEQVRRTPGECKSVGNSGGAGLRERITTAEPDRPRDSSGERARMGWDDGVAVKGADGTVRVIPRDAAEKGTQSALWPVADGIPGRVARLRTIGNAVVPQCAEVIGRRILEIARTCIE